MLSLRVGCGQRPAAALAARRARRPPRSPPARYPSAPAWHCLPHLHDSSAAQAGLPHLGEIAACRAMFLEVIEPGRAEFGQLDQVSVRVADRRDAR